MADVTKAGRSVGQGLLDVIGAVTSPIAPILEQIPKASAYYQAGMGNVAPLQMMQQQQRRDLLGQLLQQQQMQGTQPTDTTKPQIQLTPRLQSAIQSGDTDAYNKEVERQTSKASLSLSIKSNKRLLPEEQKALLDQLDAGVSPADVGKQSTELMKTRRSEERMLSREERQQQRKIKEQQQKKAEEESKMPGNILAAGLESGEISVDNPIGILGYLTDKGVKLPQKPGEQKLFVSKLLEAPRFKQYQKQQEPGFLDRLGSSILNLISSTPSQQQTPTTPQTAPTTTQPKVRKFVPGKGIVN